MVVLTTTPPLTKSPPPTPDSAPFSANVLLTMATAERDPPAPVAASHREVLEVQEAGLRDVEHTELRSGGRTLDDGVPGPVSADRQRTGNRRQTVRSVGAVVLRRQGVGARLQADQIDLAVRIRRIDGRDQARDIPRRAGEDRRAARPREPQDNDEYHQDDPPCTPTWPTASSSSTSAQHRSILHWFESHVRGTPIPGSDFFSVDRRAQCIKRLNRRRGNPSERTRAKLDARIRQRERHVPRGVTQSDDRVGM